jgi:acyl carrier protein
MKVRATLGPIRGVVHAAAVYSDATRPGFADKDVAYMRQVLEAKAEGFASLHAIFKADPLDFFVSLSSMTGIVPHLARGASDYAMANAFVEFFGAHHGCTTIAWSDWNETGAITRIDDDKAATVVDLFDRLGLRTFSNPEGCALFDRAMAHRRDGGVIIGYLDRLRFDRVAPQLLHARPEIRDAAPSTRTAAPARRIPDHALRQQIEGWKAEKRAGAEIPIGRILEVVGLEEIKQLDPALIHEIHGLLFGSSATNGSAQNDYERIIASAVKEVLKLKSLDSGQPFQSYGLDSISATILAARLEKRLQREMSPKWLIEFPTVETLSRHLVAEDGRRDQRAQ